MIRLSFDNLGAISELLDEIALEKPLDWESYNYESLKEVSVMSSIEQLNGILNNESFNDSERAVTVAAIMAYLLMENTALWIKLKKDEIT